jgi:hypothetical protein
MAGTLTGRAFFSIGAFIANFLYEEPQIRQSSQLRTPEALDDLVEHLPGLFYEPGFDQFAGYLNATPTRHIFYW